MSLHNLEKNKASTHRKRRVGRGDASGMGSYSTRGIKGQRSRSGGKSGLAVRSIKSYLLRIPKVRGFKSLQPKMAVVNLEDLEKNFSAGSTVNARAMLRADLVRSITKGVKVLSLGKLTKNLNVEATAFSKKAAEAIVKAGGKAVVVGPKKIEKDKPVKKDEVKAKEEVKSEDK
ncbi:50S ribosomal protein L15 [Candidatus Parcubacteria bacterium]|nr:50S ribosomal protein L15 [Candidatus Parcubacteria bacterium]